MKTLNGSISIERDLINDTPEKRRVHITLFDAANQSQVCKIRLSLEAFAAAVLGGARRPCVFELNASKAIGMKTETQLRLVHIPSEASVDSEKAAEALRPFETNGWVACLGDVKDPHNWHGADGVAVRFVR